MEALASDAPVLLSDIPENREFDLEDDCYFPVGDVEALARKLGGGPGAWRRSARALRTLELSNWDLAAQRMLAQVRAL